MSDTRPSENQDDYPKFPLMSALFGSAPAPLDHKFEAEDILAERAEFATSPAGSDAAAHATLYLAEQQRISNLIAFYNIHPQTRLRDAIEKGLGLW